MKINTSIHFDDSLLESMSDEYKNDDVVKLYWWYNKIWI